jgi:hypothetical protein
VLIADPQEALGPGFGDVDGIEEEHIPELLATGLPPLNFLVGGWPVFSVISLGFPCRDVPVREGLLRAQE